MWKKHGVRFWIPPVKKNYLLIAVIGSIILCIMMAFNISIDEYVWNPRNLFLLDVWPSDNCISNESKQWFFNGGKLYPNALEVSEKIAKQSAKMLPEENPSGDRVTEQLMFVPPNSRKQKLIFFARGWQPFFNSKPNPDKNLFSKCPVNTCTPTVNDSLASQADLVMFQSWYTPLEAPKSSNQLYLMRFTEHPMWVPDRFNKSIIDFANWTSSYKYDSTIPTPYFKWIYYDPNVKQMEQSRNYAQNRTKKIAWFVSNCFPNNNRNSYVEELKKYIQVDIYGKCGNLSCPCSAQAECFKLLENDYKFYLAFESTNCKEYITEKFFETALGHNVLPIVMGAPPEDYKRLAPHSSYIHVEDFQTAKELAEYLHKLDGDDELYNSYFKWKGTGEIIAEWGEYWCRVCALLHDEKTISKRLWVPDIYKFWFEADDCTKGYWRDVKKN